MFITITPGSITFTVQCWLLEGILHLKQRSLADKSCSQIAIKQFRHVKCWKKSKIKSQIDSIARLKNKSQIHFTNNLILHTYTMDVLQRYSAEYCSRLLLGVLLTKTFCVQHLENANLHIRSPLVLSLSLMLLPESIWRNIRIECLPQPISLSVLLSLFPPSASLVLTFFSFSLLFLVNLAFIEPGLSGDWLTVSKDK